MITDTGFACSEDEIRMNTPEDDARYAAIGEDLKTTGRALLATVRHLLTGYEMRVCEAAADIPDCDGVDVGCLMNLQIQFSREIARWKDGVRA